MAEYAGDDGKLFPKTNSSRQSEAKQRKQKYLTKIMERKYIGNS